MSILIAFSLTIAILVALFIQSEVNTTRRRAEEAQEAAEWHAEMQRKHNEWMNRMWREHNEWMRQSKIDHENWMREFKGMTNA